MVFLILVAVLTLALWSDCPLNCWCCSHLVLEF